MNRIAAATFAVVALFANSLPCAAAGGLAWDQVTKFSMDGSVPQPNFAQDFQAASQPAQKQPQHGGMFGGMNAAIDNAMGAMQMMKTGIAERHYVAGSFERTDNLAQQTATITDCSARTITYLDLAKKTYRVVSMDRPQQPGPTAGNRPEQPAAPRDDDGTRYKIAYASQSLGPRQIDGVNTDGYNASVAFTILRPNSDPQTMNSTVTEYVSAYAQPQQSCARFAVAGGAGAMGAMAGNMNMTRMINSAMRTPNGDPRFTVTASGPPIPSGKLDLFSFYQVSAQSAQGRGFVTIIERGNVRQINDGDMSIFGVPADFTKES